MQNQIIEIISRMIDSDDISKLKSDITLNFVTEYNIDSFKFIKIIVEIEKEFGIEIDDNYIRKMHSVQNILDYITGNYEWDKDDKKIATSFYAYSNLQDKLFSKRI